MEITIWLSFVLASFFIISAPGPSVTFLLTTSIIHGKKTAFSAIPGLFLGVFSSMILSFIGVGIVFSTHKDVYLILKTVGICYLIFLAVKTWKNAVLTAKNINPPKINIKTTFFISFLNPKSMIFYATFMPQFINIQRSYISQAVILCGTYLMLSLFINSMYSYFGDNVGHILNKQYSAILITRIGSVMMLLSALMVSIK